MSDVSELVGKTFGCMYVEKIERHKLYDRMKNIAVGYCVNTGKPLSRHISDLKKHKWCRHCLPQAPRPRKSHQLKMLTADDCPGLIPIYPDGKPPESATSLVKCKCKVCGKITSIEYMRLRIYTSCGCLSRESYKQMHKKQETFCIENTNVISLRPERHLNKNSTTGVRGVSKTPKGKFRAYITLRRRQINLGEFNTLDEARKAREEAEKIYFQPIIERWENDAGMSVSDAVIGEYVHKKPERPNKNIQKVKNKYYVIFSFKKKKYSFGGFDTIEEALEVRDKKLDEIKSEKSNSGK